MRVPSLDVANVRRTSNPDRSRGVEVVSAVRRGDASSSTATHHARGSTNVSTGYATRSSPAYTISSIAQTAGSSTGGSGLPSNS